MSVVICRTCQLSRALTAARDLPQMRLLLRRRSSKELLERICRGAGPPGSAHGASVPLRVFETAQPRTRVGELAGLLLVGEDRVDAGPGAAHGRDAVQGESPREEDERARRHPRHPLRRTRRARRAAPRLRRCAQHGADGGVRPEVRLAAREAMVVEAAARGGLLLQQ